SATSGSGQLCPVCAMTSSWTWPGRSGSPSACCGWACRPPTGWRRTRTGRPGCTSPCRWAPSPSTGCCCCRCRTGCGAADRASRSSPTPARRCPVSRWGGFAVTLRQALFGPRVTIQYPEVKRPKPTRFHGRHILNRYEDGMEKCIGCELCAGVCPAQCIYVRGADNPPDVPVSPGERFGFVYEINYLRCIHCDLCVEACPTEAITETKLFEFSFTNRAEDRKS